MFQEITPLILSFNEGANLGRVLDRLTWASRVVVLDSFSTDGTQLIARRYKNVSVFQRRFENHADQWNFGLRETGIQTEWVLALDSDYVLPDTFLLELQSLVPPDGIAGYRAKFRYCVEGIPLRGSVYTPVTELFRRKGAMYFQDGHTQRLDPAGAVRTLSSPIHHDDRKPLADWFASQVRYMELEANKILCTPFRRLDGPDKVRTLIVVAPLAILLYCLVVKGALIDGRRGWFYAAQRGVAEAILSLFLLHGCLHRRVPRG